MASSYEMFLATVALLVNTFIMACMYFVGNVIVAPIVDWAGKTITGPTAVPLWDSTYIQPFIWAFLLILEVVCVISFFIVTGRRQIIDDFY
jgi:hypothetical protein